VLVQAYEKPQHQREPKQTRLHKQLHIIVMRFINEKVRVKTAVSGLDRRERSQPPAQNWPLGKHSQAIFSDIEPHAGT
jgi:hypothetical protein